MSFKNWCVIIGLFTLTACGKSPPSKTHLSKIYTVQQSTIDKTLNFTGTIEPLSESTVTCSMSAVIETMHYHFGQFVKKGDTVFTLNSAQLQREYNDTLTDYLKAKDNYDITLSKFNGTEELWKEGLLSKNNFLSERSTLNTARVALMQSTRKLSELLDKIEDSQYDDISHLSFDEFEKVRLALTSKHNLVQLKSPTDGVLLYPPQKSDERANRLTVGTSIKPGQVLALIGDLSGIRIEIDVPEVDIANVRIGMPAIIRGLAFGQQELKGKLVAINAEASINSNSALPSFKAIVEVRSLTPKQQASIKIGMSATIELTLHRSNKLLIPIEAIKQAKGHSIVYLRDANGVVSKHPVITGMVNNDNVAIESGLKIGDVVLYE